MRSNIQLSILVATCNRPEMLKTLVQSLLDQQTDIGYEVIVLDQSDSEKADDSILGSKIKLVHCDFKNKSRALNLGVKLALSDYIAVIDDDCIAGEHWIAHLKNAFLKEGAASIITGRVIAGSQEKDAVLSRLHDSAAERIVFKKGWMTPIFKLSGCNFGFNKKIYEIVGPFNENLGPGSPFKSSEDNEWSYRALNLGFSIVYTPEAMVEHRSWRNDKEDLQLMKDYGYASGAFFKIIFRNSKFDFLYHTAKLYWWLLKDIFFSFNIHEIKVHILYGLYFCKGFLRYRFNKISSPDYLFILSPGKYIGGAERYVQNIAEELQSRNKKIVIAISHNHEYYLECHQKFPVIYLGDTLRSASVALGNFLKNRSVKAVISNGYHSSYLVNLARLRDLLFRGNSVFIDVKHGWITTNFSEKFKTFLDRFLSVFYNAVIVVNPRMKRKLWFLKNRQIIFIPSAILFKNIATTKNCNKKSYVKILLIGRLSAEKRFELVLEALSYIPNNLWELTVVGDGPELVSIKETARKNNIYERVNFVGYQEDVMPFYQNADLLIISSINEGCPLVALEAMANRVLVLSTRVGYMPTLLNDNRGFLVDVNVTPHELASKIKEIISLSINTREEILKSAQLFIKENHDLSRSAKVVVDLMLQLGKT